MTTNGDISNQVFATQLGNGTGETGLQAFPEPPTPDQIIELVGTHERFTEPLRLRMEEDWALAVLDEYDAGEGYQSYTSTEPMAYYNKIVSMLAGGQLKIRIPVSNKLKAERERQDGKERFIIGILKANDERLELLGQPELLAALAAFICLRGWFCGRSMLVKDDSGQTYVDITPWDPLHTSWGIGARGLKWICLKSKKTYDEIEEEYGVRLDNQPISRTPRDQARDSRGRFISSTYEDEEGIDVYDYLDEWYSTVVVDDQYLKDPTPHSSPRTPGFFGSVGYLPLIQSRHLGKKNNVVHYGESIFEGLRLIFPKLNLVLSTMLQLVALSRNQAFTYMSRDGTKTVEENPWLEGSQTPLAEGEEIKILELLEMSKDTAGFMALITGEVQRLGLPYSVYGQLAFQLSGYAVNLLKQATDAPVVPRKKAVERAYRQIESLICDQYATRGFDTLSLSGRDNNRDWFDEEFGPDVILGVGRPEITLVVATPQDELQRMQMAIQADASHILPRRVIWDEILNRQDTDQLATAIKEQRGEEMLPAAMLYSTGQALFAMAVGDDGQVDQDRWTLAMIYLRAAAMMDATGSIGAQLGGGGGGGGGQGASPSGFSPDILSAPDQGAPTPEPTPQPGANVPAGSPRPGARGPGGG